MKLVHMLLLGAFTTAEGVQGSCQGHYNLENGHFSLCIGDSDCTHPNNYCSEGKCNKLTKTCDGERDQDSGSDDDGTWFNSLVFGRANDVNDTDVNAFIGDWGVLKLVDKNGTELYSTFGDRIGNITE